MRAPILEVQITGGPGHPRRPEGYILPPSGFTVFLVPNKDLSPAMPIWDSLGHKTQEFRKSDTPMKLWTQATSERLVPMCLDWLNKLLEYDPMEVDFQFHYPRQGRLTGIPGWSIRSGSVLLSVYLRYRFFRVTIQPSSNWTVGH